MADPHASTLLAAPSTFYLDESGNSGDLTKAGPDLDFRGQPIFALAAIGCDDSPRLGSALDDLRRRRFPQAAELKSRDGHATPAVIEELLNRLDDLKAVLLLEVMDKRFTLAATMINTLILRPVSLRDHRADALWFRAQLAEHLSDAAPADVYDAFLDACRSPSESSLKRAFRAVLEWLPPATPRETPAGALRFFTLDSLKDFRKAGARKPDVQRRFLPLPDTGHTGKEVWILPHLSAFTSLYARINRLRSGRLSGTRIIHDEQRYFADILVAAKAGAEGLSEEYGMIDLERADYRFGESGNLTFQGSLAEPGVQAADLLAGFAMRHARDALAGGRSPSAESTAAFRRLADGRAGHRGVGMNLMLSNRDVFRCGVLPSRDPRVRPST